MSSVQWKPSSGRGTIHTWTLNHQVAHLAFAEETPYLSGTVELEEGPLIMTRLVDLKSEELRIGFPVKVRFNNSIEGSEVIPTFGPV